jgi:hypothetical protein
VLATGHRQVRGLLAAGWRAMRELQVEDEVLNVVGVEKGDRVKLRRRREAGMDWQQLREGFEADPLGLDGATGVVMEIRSDHSGG